MKQLYKLRALQDTNYRKRNFKMGCTLSDTPAPIKEDVSMKRKITKHGSTASRDMSDENFSQNQKCLLRETWDLLAPNQQQHGVAIFMRIFAAKASDLPNS